MAMDRYPLFVAMAALAILSPGPGVVLTLTNAVRHGWRGSIGGILGIACGAWLVAAACVAGLGLLLSVSATAFTVVKFLGAAYLVFLGVRLWRAPPLAPMQAPRATARRFAEGLSLQVTNPKAVFFFLSIFPQFTDVARPDAGGFVLLVLTYAVLIVVIHSGYALLASRAQRWLGSPRGGRIVNRAGAAAFVFFGAALATAKR